jgi:hypothetical protein
LKRNTSFLFLIDINTIENIVIGDGVKSIGENALRGLPANAKM